MALVVIAVAMVGVIVRVAFLQTTESETLRSAATDQWTRTTTLPGHRGTIFDRHGSELAMSVPAATISINPKLIENGPATVQLLDDLIDLSDEKVTELLAEIEQKDRGFVYVARQVDHGIGAQIEAMKLVGVNVDDESRREMPTGDTGRNVIGRTNIDGVGISGFEMQYNDLLSGVGGSMTREVAPGGRSIPGSETITERPVVRRRSRAHPRPLDPVLHRAGAARAGRRRSAPVGRRRSSWTPTPARSTRWRRCG